MTRFVYAKDHSSLGQRDSLPKLPIRLRNSDREVRVLGLVDSGATANVLPYDVGLTLGATWDAQQATLQLAGNLGGMSAMPLVLMGEVDGLSPVQLVFAWSRYENVPIILGQVNFFMAFKVCFDRAKFEFEIMREVR